MVFWPCMVASPLALDRPGERLRPPRHLLLHSPGSHRRPHRDLAPQCRRPVPREGLVEPRLRQQDPRLAALWFLNREWDPHHRPAHARGVVPVPRASTSFPAAHPLGRAAGHRHEVRLPLGVLQGQDPPLLLPGFHRPGDAARSSSSEASRASLRPLLLPWPRNLVESPSSPFARADQLVRPHGIGRARASWCRERPRGRRAQPPKSLGPAAGRVHAIDVLACPRCGSRMAVIAVIVDPAQIRKIITCLRRHGRGPPPLG